MSTGADCRFYEKKPGKWYYDLQEWPYGENPDYETFGPFSTFRDAHQHLGDYHPNPGGFAIDPLPGCPHDIKQKLSWPAGFTHECDRCGAHLTIEEE